MNVKPKCNNKLTSVLLKQLRHKGNSYGLDQQMHEFYLINFQMTIK